MPKVTGKQIIGATILLLVYVLVLYAGWRSSHATPYKILLALFLYACLVGTWIFGKKKKKDGKR